MLISLLAHVYGEKKHQAAVNREKQLGYKLQLNHLSPGWINATHLYDMTPVWQKYGLHAQGVNYFTMGKINNGLCSRFDPLSPYYQAWLGGYTVQFPNPREWTINDHYDLCVADQKNWLRVYGDRKPHVEIDYKNIKDLGNITVSGFTGKIFEGSIWSDTDVGSGNWYPKSQFVGAYESYQFHKGNDKLTLKPQNFIPQWNEKSILNSYQTIYLRGYGAIIQITKNTKAILYANGAIYKDKNGKEYNTFKQLHTQLKKLLEEIEIIKL